MASQNEGAASAGHGDGSGYERLAGALDLHRNFPYYPHQAGTVIGIDLANAGAIAVLRADGELLAVHDVPVLNNGPAGRPTVNPVLLAEIIAQTTPAVHTRRQSVQGPQMAQQALSPSAGAWASSRASSRP